MRGVLDDADSSAEVARAGNVLQAGLHLWMKAGVGRRSKQRRVVFIKQQSNRSEILADRTNRLALSRSDVER